MTPKERMLLRALKGVLPYAENEAEALHSLVEDEQSADQAEDAALACEYAQRVIAAMAWET